MIRRCNKAEILCFSRFLFVGIINTLVTYIVYFVLRYFCVIPELCNAIGYIAGVINSFIWNKKWVFKTKGTDVRKEMLGFALVFVVCYGIQFFVFTILLYQFVWNEYIVQLLSMCMYTLLNYVLNKFISFRQSKVF